MKIQLDKLKVNHKKKQNFIGRIKEEDSDNEFIDEYDRLIKSLKIKKDKRIKKDYSIINTYLCNNIDYFKNLAAQIGENTLEKITGFINYNHFPSGYKIYSYGDEVDRLYIILKGSVKIFRPVPVKNSMSLRDFVEHIVNIRDIEKDEIKFIRIQAYNTNLDKEKLIKLDYDYTKIPPSKEEIFIIEEEKEVDKLEEGKLFGEITFSKNEKRKETIIANEPCDIVNLDLAEYGKLVSIEQQKINNKLADFRIEYPIFKFWNNSNLMNLIKCLVDEKYEKGDYIYKQNDKPEYIYLIKEGVIEVFNHCKFSIYEDFIEYIYDDSNSLTRDMDNPELWEKDKILEKMSHAFEELEFLRFNLRKRKYEDDEDLKYMDINKQQKQKREKINQKLIEQMEKINTKIRDYQYRANIQKYSAPQVFGCLEAIELKRRFCSMKCYSNKAVVSKIPIMNFLLLIPRDKKNIFYFQSMIFEEKKYLIEQIKNNAFAKLSFISMNSLKNTLINQYNSYRKTRENFHEFKFKKILKFRNEPNFPFNTNRLLNKNSIRSECKNKSSINLDRIIIKKKDIINLKKKLENDNFEDSKSIIGNNFKKTMVKLKEKTSDDIKKLFQKNIKNDIDNFELSNTNLSLNKDNNYSRIFQNHKKSSSISPKKPFSISMGDLTTRNHNLNIKLNFTNRNNDIRSMSTRNKDLILPNINMSKI